MNDFEALAKMAWSQYGHQSGLIDIVIEGNPGTGLRYKFCDSDCASQFMRLRQLHNSYEPMFANALRHDKNDVVEIWGELTGYRGSLR
jgi:hypothetical protein